MNWKLQEEQKIRRLRGVSAVFSTCKAQNEFKLLMFIKEEWEGVLLHERKLITWISSVKVIKCSVSMEKKIRNNNNSPYSESTLHFKITINFSL